MPNLSPTQPRAVRYTKSPAAAQTDSNDAQQASAKLGDRKLRQLAASTPDLSHRDPDRDLATKAKPLAQRMRQQEPPSLSKVLEVMEKAEKRGKTVAPDGKGGLKPAGIGTRMKEGFVGFFGNHKARQGRYQKVLETLIARVNDFIDNDIANDIGKEADIKAKKEIIREAVINNLRLIFNPYRSGKLPNFSAIDFAIVKGLALAKNKASGAASLFDGVDFSDPENVEMCKRLADELKNDHENEVGKDEMPKKALQPVKKGSGDVNQQAVIGELENFIGLTGVYQEHGKIKATAENAAILTEMAKQKYEAGPHPIHAAPMGAPKPETPRQNPPSIPAQAGTTGQVPPSFPTKPPRARDTPTIPAQAGTTGHDPLPPPRACRPVPVSRNLPAPEDSPPLPPRRYEIDPEISSARRSATSASQQAAPVSLGSKKHTKDVKFGFAYGDITTFSADVIVNAANSRLLGGEGVDGAIRKVAGSQLDEECARIMEYNDGLLDPGTVVHTRAPNFEGTKFLFHAVAPDLRESKHLSKQQQNEGLARCYKAVINMADELKCKTIIFPALGTGNFGWDFARATKIALNTVGEAVKTAKSIENVIFCCLKEEQAMLYEKMNEERLAAIKQRQALSAETIDRSSAAPPLARKTIKPYWKGPNAQMLAPSASKQAALVSPESKRAATAPRVLLDVIKGDIELQLVDGIVTAADKLLSDAGTEVNRAIRAKAGPDLANECSDLIKENRHRAFKPGQVVDTRGCSLLAKRVFHAVVPTADASDSLEDKKRQLASCYENTIELAEYGRYKSLAFPPLGTDIFGGDSKKAAEFAVDVVRKALENSRKLQSVFFCSNDPKELEAYKQAVNKPVA